MKRRFDLKGYLLFPSVLSEEDMAPIRAQCEALRSDHETLPPAARCPLGGAADEPIDHPVMLRVLHGIIDDETEKLRQKTAFSYRTMGDGYRGWNPHAGGRSVNPNYCIASRR